MPRVAADAVPVTIGMPAQVASDLRAFAEANGWSQAEAIAQLLGAWQDLRRAEAEAQNLRDELRQRMTSLEQREARLAAQEEAYRQGHGLTQQAVALLRRLVEAGVGREEALAVADAIGAAGVPASEAARLIRRLGGAQQWVQTTEQALQRLRTEREQAEVELRARKQAVALLERRLQELSETLEELRHRAESERQALQELQRQAEDMGMAIEVSRLWSGGRPTEMPLDLGRAVAGAILLVLVEAHGDRVLRLPVNPAVGRMIELRIALSELPNLLAPAQTYARMRQVLLAARTEAERLATSPAGDGDAPEQEERETGAPT